MSDATMSEFGTEVGRITSFGGLGISHPLSQCVLRQAKAEVAEPFACVFVRRHTPRSSITLLPFGLGSKSQNSTAVQILRPVWFLPVFG